MNIKWKLHTAYRPQSPGMVERTNRTLKETLSKWIIETDCSWVDLLPMALLKLRMTPRSHGYSPYEIVYGRPPPIIRQVTTDILQRHGTTDWFQIGKRVRQGCILSPCLSNLHAEYIMRNAGLNEAQAGIKIAGRNINNLRYTDETPPLWQKEKRN